MPTNELLRWRLEAAQRADDLERTLGDVVDVKAGVLLVVITFLAGISVQLITLRGLNHSWQAAQVVVQTVALGLLIYSGIMSVVELYPRRYKLAATPAADEQWVAEVTKSLNDDAEAVLNEVQTAKLKKACERVEHNRKVNETKARHLERAFSASIIALALVLGNVLALAVRTVRITVLGW